MCSGCLAVSNGPEAPSVVPAAEGHRTPTCSSPQTAPLASLAAHNGRPWRPGPPLLHSLLVLTAASWGPLIWEGGDQGGGGISHSRCGRCMHPTLRSGGCVPEEGACWEPLTQTCGPLSTATTARRPCDSEAPGCWPSPGTAAQRPPGGKWLVEGPAEGNGVDMGRPRVTGVR